MENIGQAAGETSTEFLQYWNALPIERRYEKLLDRLAHNLGKYLDFIGTNSGKTIGQKVNCLEMILKEMET